MIFFKHYFHNENVLASLQKLEMGSNYRESSFRGIQSEHLFHQNSPLLQLVDLPIFCPRAEPTVYLATKIIPR
jgi:hypothetical protein